MRSPKTSFIEQSYTATHGLMHRAMYRLATPLSIYMYEYDTNCTYHHAVTVQYMFKTCVTCVRFHGFNLKIGLIQSLFIALTVMYHVVNVPFLCTLFMNIIKNAYRGRN
jgi:hypothetical protein